MLPTNIPSATCTRCGWHNEATARMCGGCGMPLRTSDPGATSNVDIVSGLVSPALPATPAPVETPYPPDAPTAAALHLDQPQQAYVHSAPAVTASPRQHGVAPPVWTAPAAASHDKKRAQARARGPWWRAPLIALVVLSVLAGGGLGAWAFIIRPPIHSQVDAKMRASLYRALDQVATKISQLPRGRTLQVTVPATEVEQQIAQNIPAGSPISDIHIHFANGGILISYSLDGSTGTITTRLQTKQGRPQARATSVDYPLGFVESGDEMESALNDAFARLPSDLVVLAVSAINDTLTLNVHT